MNLLSSQQIQVLLDQLIEIREEIDKTERIESQGMPLTVYALQRFEHRLTLNELETCFHESEGDALTTNLIRVLTQRWNRIRQSTLCYTQKPSEPVNELCLAIARAIAPPAATEDEIEALEPLTGPYCLIMPTLEVSKDVYGDDIHSLGLHEFVLSDDERAYIPIRSCLHLASVSDEAALRHLVMIDGAYPNLTSSEEKRVALHSVEARVYYEAVIKYNRSRIYGDHLGAQLTQLAQALRAGGAHRAGEEMNAASQANLGIIRFNAYWERFTSRQQSEIFLETPELKGILGRLFEPTRASYQSTNYCVELIASDLDPIIQKYNQKTAIQILRRNVTNQEKSFILRSKSPTTLVTLLMRQNEKAPSHILHRIFQLSSPEQAFIFRSSHEEDALSYALVHYPDALFEFELDDKAKKRAIDMVFNGRGENRFILAAKQGRVDLMDLFLDWGSNAQAFYSLFPSALYQAACSGHCDAVNYLLMRGGMIYSKSPQSIYAALHGAMEAGHIPVIECLLRQGVPLQVLDCSLLSGARTIHHKRASILFVLMYLSTLPVSEQQHFQRTRPYPNVLFYVARAMDSMGYIGPIETLWSELIDHVLNKADRALILELFAQSDSMGSNLLMLASQFGASQAVRKILNNIPININQYDGTGATALHLAASQGYAGIVDCLCEHGAFIEARNSDGNTPLHLALIGARYEVVERLLRKNASIEVANNSRLNAVDMAFRSGGRNRQLMLMHLATLPLTQQKSLLRDRRYDYDNVATYILFDSESFSFFNAVCNKTLSDHKEKYGPEISNFLTQLHFDDHIKRMTFHYQEMHYKSLTNPRYTAAMIAAKNVLCQCMHARAVLLSSSPVPIDEKISAFKETCREAIERGRPVLSRHRAWGKVFGAFLVSLLLPISLPLYAFGVFSVKTQSARLLNNFQHDLERPRVSAP